MPAARRASLDDFVERFALRFTIDNCLPGAQIVAQHFGNKQATTADLVDQPLGYDETQRLCEALPDLFLLVPAEKAEYGEAQYSAWQTMQRAHAISNGVFVGAVNRVGFEHGDVLHNGVTMKGPEGPGLEFWGTSFLCDPFGVMVAEASPDKEEIVVGEVDLVRLEDVRRNWPFLRDRRIDAYAGLDRRFID